MNAGSVDIVVTSPPYNLGINSSAPAEYFEGVVSFMGFDIDAEYVAVAKARVASSPIS